MQSFKIRKIITNIPVTFFLLQKTVEKYWQSVYFVSVLKKTTYILINYNYITMMFHKDYDILNDRQQAHAV